ncbi:RNA methyltransferase [Cellulomonas sp. NPDC089187]|uniref:TrmH family RNA methyltransferase n=1 Tax=Cellulomonas sp. NPDC089187 TaxID=3154970 RepID=UPI00342C3A6A
MPRRDIDPTTATLTNPQADRVRAVHSLAQRASRRRTGQYLVEGPQAVRELVRWSPESVRDVYLTPESAGRYPEIVAAAADLFLHIGTPEVLAAMSSDAQGVLAVATPPEGQVGPLPAASLATVLDTRPQLIALLARVRDPGNLGTVIRVADAAGADAVIVAGDSVEVTNPKVVRSTAGSLFHLPVVHGWEVDEAVAALRASGSQVVAADGAGDLDLDDLQDAAARAEGDAPVDLRRPTTWLFGNEAWGLPEADRAAADAVVRVPLRGKAESLNLATAAAVCLYASSRAHR